MKKTMLAAALAVLSLSGCSSLSGKSPQEMMQISVARSLKQDYSYDFSGDTRVYLEQLQGAAADARDSAMAIDKTEKADEAAKSFERELMQAMQGEDGRLGAVMADALQEYPALANYLANGRLNMYGAVDLRRELLELTTELQLNGRNEQVSVKMPVLFDGKAMSVTIDPPAAVPLVLNFLTGKDLRTRLINEPLRFTLKDADKQGLPVRNIIKAAVYAAYQAYAELPADSFQLKEMDSFGKEAGSRYRVEMLLDDAATQAYNEAALAAFNKKLNELEQTSPEAGATAEGYAKVREISRSIAEVLPQMSMAKLYGGPMYVSFYLDGKGRMKGMRQYVQFDGSEGQTLHLDSRLKMYNFGNPTFTFRPETAQTIGFEELKASMDAHLKGKRAGRLNEPAAATDWDAIVPSEPYKIEESVSGSGN